MGADDNAGKVETTVRMLFDVQVYSIAAIKKAAYRFLKNFDVEIAQESETWVCTLTFPTTTSADAMRRAQQDFRAEVLDQDLRAGIARETEPLRNAILALAFSQTGLQGSE